MANPSLGSWMLSKQVNRIQDVRNHLTARFNSNFIVFNIGHECNYDKREFYGRVIKIPVKEGAPPTMSQILTFLEQAQLFMEGHQKNSIVVHSRQGKGRTGTMICAWLLYCRFRQTATDAMQWFELTRTGKAPARNLLSASQQRYVRYVEKALVCEGFNTPALFLAKIVVKACPCLSVRNFKPSIIIEENGSEILQCDSSDDGHTNDVELDPPRLVFPINREVKGDIHFRVLNGKEEAPQCCSFVCGKSNNCAFQLWFHTGFIASELTVFRKEDIDFEHPANPVWEELQDNFAVELQFDNFATSHTVDESQENFQKILKPSKALTKRVKDWKAQLLSESSTVSPGPGEFEPVTIEWDTI